jgi:Gpi18-like mannosyltransferase
MLEQRVFWIMCILTLGLVVHISIAPFSAHLYDMQVWYETGEFIVHGAYLNTDNATYNIYTFAQREFAAGNYPEGAYIYTPLWAYICAFSYLVTQFLSQVGFIIGGHSYFLQLFIFKIPIILTNMFIALVLVKIARLHHLSNKYTYFLLIGYLFNPYVLGVTSIWGNFHNIAVLFTLLSYYFFQRENIELSFFCLGLGIAVKLYPILIVPIYLVQLKWDGIRDLIKKLCIILSPTFLICLPFIIWDFTSFFNVMVLTGGSTSFNNFSWWSGVMRLLNLYVATPTDPLDYGNRLLATMVIINNIVAYGSLFLSYYWVKKKKLSLLSGTVLTFLVIYVTHRYVQETAILWVMAFVLLDLVVNRSKISIWWLLPLLVLGSSHSLFGDPVWVIWGDWFRTVLPFSRVLSQNVDWIVRYIYSFFSALYILQILRKSGFKLKIIENFFQQVTSSINKYRM